LLKKHMPLSLADNGLIQADTVSWQAKRFLELVLPLAVRQQPLQQKSLYALQLLQVWDYDMRAERIEPSLFFGWLTFFTSAVYAQALGPELAAKLLNKRAVEGFPLDPYLEVAPELVMNWIAGGPPDWIGDIEALLLPALDKTVSVLKERFGSSPDKWQWGKLHKIILQHPVARIPLLGRSWKPRYIPVSGDGYTINQSDVKLQFPPDAVGVVASCRLLIDVGEWDNSLAVLPGGQSGYPASPNYQDGLVDWQNGRYHPLLYSREKIEAAAEWRLFLEPNGSSPKMGPLEE
jgi:penicillin G amidase